MIVFRRSCVWTDAVDAIVDSNLEGIILIFNKYTESDLLGFNYDSAKKVLKDSGIEIDPRESKIQFDLAQMAVLDEHLGAAEYADMELVEFYEFLVRVSYIAPDEENGPGDTEAPSGK
jgi:hypothetical protein